MYTAVCLIVIMANLFVQVEKLLELMDPCNTGNISFIMFCRGVETFRLGESCGCGIMEGASGWSSVGGVWDCVRILSLDWHSRTFYVRK